MFPRNHAYFQEITDIFAEIIDAFVETIDIFGDVPVVQPYQNWWIIHARAVFNTPGASKQPQLVVFHEIHNKCQQIKRM